MSEEFNGIINELVEKRFNETVYEVVTGNVSGDYSYSYSNRSLLVEKLKAAIAVHVEEIIKQREQDIKNAVNKQIDKLFNNIQISVTLNTNEQN